ncbi:hypothetical protein Syun_022901 [Stephania yunnanensis]|uniref:Uncharacterized protein n=1 Tax=Stephania yunnanensis TaxID=152371 RepID=A0AAP0I347_9MAGN
MARGRRRKENREKREVSVRKKKNKMEGGEVDVYLSDIVYLVHTVFGVLEMALSGSEVQEDRKGKRKLEDFY